MTIRDLRQVYYSYVKIGIKENDGFIYIGSLQEIDEDELLDREIYCITPSCFLETIILSII